MARKPEASGRRRAISWSTCLNFGHDGCNRDSKPLASELAAEPQPTSQARNSDTTSLLKING